MSTDPDAEPPASLTPGRLLDARHVLDDQTFDALDDQHRRLAARVDALEAAVAMLEDCCSGDRPTPCSGLDRPVT